MGALAIQMKQALRILRHPINGFWELRYENKAGILSASLILILFYLVALFSDVLTGFVFYPVETKFIDPFLKFSTVMIPWITWVVANYMVGSISKGQGRFIDVFIGSAYALTPYIIFTIPLALFSNVLTLGEGAIYYFGKLIIYGWTLFLFFIFVQEVHNYEIGETVLVILLSIFFMLALWILILIFVGLSAQLVDFVVQVYEEVTYRE